MSQQVLNAPVEWAQRKEQIFLSITLQDIKDPKISIEPTKLTFEGTSSGNKYKAEIEFYGEIDPQKSKYIVRPRAAEFVLVRKEPGAYWPHLLKQKGKYNWLKADWNKWKDEDEVDADDVFETDDMSGMGGGGMGGGGMDMDSLQKMLQQQGGMGGIGGMGGMEGEGNEEESDEELPDLEEDGKEKKEAKKEEEKKEEKKEEEQKTEQQ